jgi:hypothetical protein
MPSSVSGVGLAKLMPMRSSSLTSDADTGFGWIADVTWRPPWLSCATKSAPPALLPAMRRRICDSSSSCFCCERWMIMLPGASRFIVSTWGGV